MGAVKKLFDAMQTHRKAIYVLVVLACVLNGLFLSFASYRQTMDMGDSSTFYAFSRAAARGEVPFKDFIHFRTPGTIGLHVLFIHLFGEQQSSSKLATLVETTCLFPLLAVLAAIVFYKNKKHPLYVIAAFAGLAFFPPVAQLRAGFGLLAVACYATSFERGRHQKRWLWAAGLLTGVTFIFGQEIALMVGVCMVAGELLGQKREVLWTRFKVLAAGTFLGVLPLLAYILVVSDFGTFVYYVTYYSFVLQPKYMNVPFPGIGYGSLFFYLPFLMYGLCFVVLFANRALGKKESLLLSFAILRLITALGRADTGHLLFSVPEVFVVIPYFLVSIPGRQAVFSKRVLRTFMPYGALMVALFALSVVANSIFLVFVPFLMLYALGRRPSAKGNTKPSQWGALNVYLALGSSFVLFIYLLFPFSQGFLKYAKEGLTTRHTPAPRIGGVKFEPVIYQEIMEVKAVVDPLRPNTVFAFPIQPFYYTLAPHHAARYFTYEPQTTVDEQDKTIEDLKRTKPEVIIFDPLQAHGLSGSLWKISDYITENYEIRQEIAHQEILWVMTPKQSPGRDAKLAFQLYKDNQNKADALAVQNKSTGLENAIIQQADTIRFFVDTNKESSLRLSVYTQPGSSECGKIVVRYSGSESKNTDVCAKDGEVDIPIKANAKNVELLFEEPRPSHIIWDDVRVVER